MWIQYAWYNPNYERDFFRSAMKKLFIKFWRLQTVAIIVPPIRSNKNIAWFVRHAVEVKPPNHPKGQSIYLIQRTAILNSYNVRWAVEEDNDDIIELIECECTRFKETYGEFYVDEILTRHQESTRKFIVAEYETKTVAVLSLNKRINYDLLSKNFELSCFRYLKKTLNLNDFEADEELETNNFKLILLAS